VLIDRLPVNTIQPQAASRFKLLPRVHHMPEINSQKQTLNKTTSDLLEMFTACAILLQTKCLMTSIKKIIRNIRKRIQSTYVSQLSDDRTSVRWRVYVRTYTLHTALFVHLRGDESKMIKTY
jgi:hypothetical protein